MLLNGLAVALLVGVEGNQALRLSAILQAIYDDVAHYVLVVNLGLEILRQLGEECKLLEVYDELVDARCAFILVYVLEQLLKHA